MRHKPFIITFAACLRHARIAKSPQTDKKCPHNAPLVWSIRSPRLIVPSEFGPLAVAIGLLVAYLPLSPAATFGCGRLRRSVIAPNVAKSSCY